MLADAEVLKVFSELLTSFKLDFNLRLNDRRLLDLAVTERAGTKPEMFNSICGSLDKLDKISWDKVSEELHAQKGIDKDKVNLIGDFVHIGAEGSSSEVIQRLSTMFKPYPKSQQVLSEIKLLNEYCEAMEINDRIKIDTTLARGLDYYTGMIFEAVIVGGEEAKLKLGSIAAGGRYDNLIGMFSKNPIPSAGGSLGIERILNILEARAAAETAV